MTDAQKFVYARDRLILDDRVYVRAVNVVKTRFGYEAYNAIDAAGRAVYALPGGGRATEAELRESCLAQTAS